MNFRWNEAVWLALDDCGDYLTTEDVYLHVKEYRQLTEHQLELDNQRVMRRYKNTVRNILNNFRSRCIIEGVKENPNLKYGHYRWVDICAGKENRKEIRKKIECGFLLEYVIGNSTLLSDLPLCESRALTWSS